MRHFSATLSAERRGSRPQIWKRATKIMDVFKGGLTRIVASMLSAASLLRNIIGTRHAIAPRKTEWAHELATFRVELYCNGELSQRGAGSLVPDSRS